MLQNVAIVNFIDRQFNCCRHMRRERKGDGRGYHRLMRKLVSSVLWSPTYESHSWPIPAHPKRKSYLISVRGLSFFTPPLFFLLPLPHPPSTTPTTYDYTTNTFLAFWVCQTQSWTFLPLSSFFICKHLGRHMR